MEKTDMMKQFEAETGKQSAILKFMSGGQALEQKSYPKLGPYDYNMDYIAWLEAKATAYDRIMNGGKKTLKELANFLQRPIAIQPSRSGCVAIFANVPFLGETEWRGYWMSTIACDFDFSGDWKDSLTLPDGWEDGSMEYFIEDYEGSKHTVKSCPVCGKAPERNNCGPELQGVSCFDCDVHSTFCKEIGSNDMLLKAIEKWNDGKFDVPTNS